MSSKVVVIAPHPDDETLGCGGTLLKHKKNGDEVFWVIVTCLTEQLGYGVDKICTRKDEIHKVSQAYGFDKVLHLEVPTTSLDQIPKSEIIRKFGILFDQIEPNIVYAPYRNDAHSDHEVVFDATVACTKSFRNPYINTLRIYETLSETEFGMRPEDSGFKPNYFVNITDFFEKKLEIMKLYYGEILPHPFPRSVECIESLALLRGSYVGCKYSESFMTLKDTWR